MNRSVRLRGGEGLKLGLSLRVPLRAGSERKLMLRGFFYLLIRVLNGTRQIDFVIIIIFVEYCNWLEFEGMLVFYR